MAERDTIIGWDIGGAHVKACLLRAGRVADVAQWPCPLWLGMDRLDTVLRAAWQRWPDMARARHAITMTGEMADLFADREQGVLAIAAALGRSLEGPLQFFAADGPWLREAELPAHWAAVASANWLATARHAALVAGTGVLVDIGSTTTDLVPFVASQVATRSRTDADRLATGELVYHGVVRTPLCAVAHRIDWRGQARNVMNEFFATTADVYRLTGELDPAHDQHASADNAPKDHGATCQRLARMVGLDRRDAHDEDWLAFARSWRAQQLQVLAGELRRVMATHRLGAGAAIVSAGCGAFLVDDLLASAGADASAFRRLDYGSGVAQVMTEGANGAALQRWARVCAPSVAVAALLDMER